MGLFQPLRFDGLASLDVGIVRAVAAVNEAAAIGAAQGAEIMADAWRQNIETILVHGYATGKYLDSIQVTEPKVVNDTETEVEVFTDAVNEKTGEDYPTDLEYGTSSIPGGYPTMTPAFESTREEVVAKVAEVEAEALAVWFP